MRSADVSTRAEILLASVPKHSRIIEIGPSFNPIAPKSQGWNSTTLDHLTQEGLVTKYKAHPVVDVSKIEEVDFVWTGGKLTDAVPQEQHGSFDVFLASHVIEHTPDFIGFLDAAATLLKQDGVTILAVPDKRYCFDYFQQITTTGQVLDAHLNNRWRHTGALAFDHFAYAVTDGGVESWVQRTSQGLQLIHRLEDSYHKYRIFEDSPIYEDMHAWHFVPASFELLLLELARLGEIDWRVECVRPTAGWEFFAWLRRGAIADVQAMPEEVFNSRRVALLKRALLETQAQIDCLVASEPELTPLPFAASPFAKSQEEVIDLRTRLAAMEHKYAAAMQRVAALEFSTVWRASLPLRTLVDGVRRARARLTRPIR
jgi:predicted SAM-dependent methyltransferase